MPIHSRIHRKQQSTRAREGACGPPSLVWIACENTSIQHISRHGPMARLTYIRLYKYVYIYTHILRLFTYTCQIYESCKGAQRGAKGRKGAQRGGCGAMGAVDGYGRGAMLTVEGCNLQLRGAAHPVPLCDPCVPEVHLVKSPLFCENVAKTRSERKLIRDRAEERYGAVLRGGTGHGGTGRGRTLPKPHQHDS